MHSTRPRGLAGRKAAFLLLASLAAAGSLAACASPQPQRPVYRQVETDEDRLYLWCVSEGIFRADPRCRQYVSNKDR